MHVCTYLSQELVIVLTGVRVARRLALPPSALQGAQRRVVLHIIVLPFFVYAALGCPPLPDGADLEIVFSRRLMAVEAIYQEPVQFGI